MNKLTIHINGIKYSITSGEDPDYVHALAREIDENVKTLMEGTTLSINEALVLVSLSYLDSFKKSEEGADHLRRQVTEYAEDAAKARSELAESRKEWNRMLRGGGGQ